VSAQVQKLHKWIIQPFCNTSVGHKAVWSPYRHAHRLGSVRESCNRISCFTLSLPLSPPRTLPARIWGREGMAVIVATLFNQVAP